MITISANSLSNWVDSGIRDNEKYLMVNSCGYQKFVTRDFSISRANGRVDFQLIYIINGKGRFTFGNTEREIGEGHIILYKPNEPQNYRYYFTDKPELYWVHFTGNAVYDILSELYLNSQVSYFVGMDNDCVDLFKKMIFELNMKRPSYGYYTSAYMMELMAHFSRLAWARKHETVLLDDDIKKTITLMHSNYNAKYTICDYAKDCNLSESRFIHKFKASTGKTPVQYIMQIRMNEAKDLLSYSSLNISEVSSIIGYENPLYFSRIFKRETGMSPSEYKSAVAYGRNTV